MKKRSKQSLSALDVIEEAVHQLRLRPFSLLATHYVGTVPFVLAFVYFWTDMSSSAFASARCGSGALVVALLFLWMKWWQAAFAVGIRRRLAGSAGGTHGFQHVARRFAVQTIVQPLGFIALPVASLIALPFGWTYAFFQNLSALDDGESPRKRDVLRSAWQQAGVDPAENHILISVLSLFALVVFANIAVAMLFLPKLVKMFLGMETVFTRSGFHMLNTTFLAVACAGTYLCVDPLVKAAYAIRCFHGLSLRTGEDLTVELRAISRRAARTVVVFIVLACCGSRTVAEPPSQSAVALAPRPSSTELNRRIDEVIHRSEYTWRMPREWNLDEEDPGVIVSFLRAVTETLADWIKALGDWLERVVEWFFKRFPKWTRGHHRPGGSWLGSADAAQALLLGALALVASVLAVFALRAWRQRRRGEAQAEAVDAMPVPDVSDDSTSADELPSDEWPDMAEHLARRGEWRLALRAAYLATLAFLADRELLVIARHKSNRDYRAELSRRGHALPSDATAAFADNVAAVECTWYGDHAATLAMFAEAKDNFRRITASVGGA